MPKGPFSFLREVFLNLLIPSIYLAFLIIVLKTGTWPDWKNLTGWEIVASLTLAAGLLLWGISYLYVPPTIYLSPQATKLVTSGPYRYLRHPIYVGALVAFVSFSYLSHSCLALWYTALVIFPLNIGRAVWEEKILLDIFGEQYRRYQRKTLI